jgi:hypothetical protein
MIRKTLLLTLAFLALPLFSQATKAPVTLRKFVQGFYDWYVPLTQKDSVVPEFNLAISQKGSYFSPQLSQALKEDSAAEAEANGDIVGLDWDPFLNSQDPYKRYVVGKITKKSDSFLVNIHGVSFGKRQEKPDVVAELVQKNGHWLFVNFHSPEGWDLLTALKSLRDNRQAAPQ